MNNYPSKEELIKNAGTLMSFPDVCLQVNTMIDDPSCSASSIGEVLSRDSALTARLLKIVNSPFYGFSSRIDTVSRAISVIGLRELQMLVTTAAAVEAFSKISTRLIDMETFWRHSVFCAVIAKIIAEHCNVLHSERLFISGLLHDIGSLVLYQSLPEQVESILENICAHRERSQHEIEHELLGYNHAELGAALLRKWQLPDSICEAVEFHHETEKSQRFAIETSIVGLANSLAGVADKENLGEPVYFITEYRKILQETSETALDKIRGSANWQTAGVSSDNVDDILEEAVQRFDLALDAIYQ